MKNFISASSIEKLMSWLLAGLSVVLGAVGGMFGMAVGPVVEAPEANPSNDMSDRPASEQPKADEQGFNTQLQNKAATATDVRDAGLEAESIDKDIVNFKKHKFPFETYIANLCPAVKVDSYIHSHYRSGTTSLEADYAGAPITITAGADSTIAIGGSPTVKVYINTTKTLTLPSELFDNPDCLTEYSTVLVRSVNGFKPDGQGGDEADGELILFVENHDDNGNVKFKVMNPPIKVSGGASQTVIPTGAKFYVMAPACSESQIRVAPESYLPERVSVTLQKKNMSVMITDEFEQQSKKVPFIKKDVVANAVYNFRRKCSRSHWNGTEFRLDVKVPELNGNREAAYGERGVLRQIPMLYTHQDALTYDDFAAISSLMFTENAASEEAIAFCGKKQIKRIMALVNSAVHYKDVASVEVDEFGIRVRKYADNFGTIKFVHEETLDDLGYENYMAVLDLKNAVRYYKRNEKEITQDMSQTGESREATAYNKSVIDCIALKGYNAVLVCPSKAATVAANLGGIEANIVSVAALPAGGDLEAAGAKFKKYYLTAEDSGFGKGTIVEWDFELGDWKEFEGIIR